MRPQFSLAALVVLMTGSAIGLWAAMQVYRSMENLTLSLGTMELALCLIGGCIAVAGIAKVLE